MELDSFHFYQKGRILVLIPFVGILIALVYYLIYPGSLHQSPWGYVISGIATTATIWIGCMIIVEYLWRKYPWERHPSKHLILEIVLILVYLTLCVPVSLFILYGTDFEAWFKELSRSGMDAFNTALITFLITAIHEAYFFYKQWKMNFSKSIQLEKEILQTQLNSLKAQVNPHFLFNSLNSLAGLLENNPKAEKFVLDLSEYLRYVLQNSARSTVSLKEELENLEKYLSLQNIRFGHNLIIKVEITPSALEKSLPPLTLQMLAENCIKHNKVTQENPLHIQLKADSKRAVVSNNLQKISASNSNGQGLENLKGRYRFLTSETLQISETSHSYSVSVPLLSPNNSIENEHTNSNH
jgi:sensor histidine kinase YesM